MQKLYLDCDGVILNTVADDIYEMLVNMGITDSDDITSYFAKLNWDEFIAERGQIDNACTKIKELCKYFDV